MTGVQTCALPIFHRTTNVHDGYMGSGSLIRSVIEKEGIEHFEKSIIAVFDNPQEMIELETNLVNENFLKRKDVYNLKLGGLHDHLSTWIQTAPKEVITKISRHRGESGRRKIQELKQSSLEFRNLLKKNQSLGMRRAIEEGRKIYKKGHRHSEETKEKIRNTTKNSVSSPGKEDDFSSKKIKIHNPLTKENRIIHFSELGKLLNEGWNEYHYNHKDETKQKISQSRKNYEANKDPDEKLIWIVNNELFEIKKIKKRDLESFLSRGWARGRKIKRQR